MPATTNGNANWAFCVTEVPFASIGDFVAGNADAVGFSDLTGFRQGNRALAVSGTLISPTNPGIPLSIDNLRSFAYPLTHFLYISWVTGSRVPSDDEQALLDLMLDRDFPDPILDVNGFVTCSLAGC